MRLRLESVTTPGLVLADELTERSECVRGGKPVEGYVEPRFLEPGMATLQVYELASPGETGISRSGRIGTRDAVYAVRRMADDPADDGDLTMASLPFTDAARSILGPGFVEPHRAVPPARGSSPGGRRRRSQVAAGAS